ncbi:hypothetical protein OAA83_03260 [Candidatus Marinimicrobia bacterium]|jgi:hypothetical protein|nr:hypothetical protein [Candidatus Neomarinimicrobiota bacterium]MDB9722928.1 hypothetical protein [Candidatus Neomarinimicrobiota bacterium]|tara:strand:+ start:2094 stop:2654 length:561 start_codon:yes stop_codon:yes gene_type:complete
MNKYRNTIAKLLLAIFIINPSSIFATSFIHAVYNPKTGERVSSNSASITVPAKTMIRLRATTTHDGRISSQGEMVYYSVVNDIKVNGVVVIQAGAQASGTIIEVIEPAKIGFPGLIAVELQSVTAVDGTEIPLDTTTVNEGENKIITSIIFGMLCLFGFFMSGGEASIQAGSTIDAITKSPVEVNA